MSTTERTDLLLQAAARFYGVHSAIMQLGDKAPSQLQEEFSLLASKVESFGGKIVTGLDALGQKGPVILGRNKQPIDYGLGCLIAEHIVSGVLAALPNQA